MTDKSITHNRPDIVLIYKFTRITYLIDIAIPNSCNIQKTILTKINKYQDLAEEVKGMWNMESVIVIPIVISDIGLIPNSLFENLRILDLNSNIYIQMQKAVILSTCSIVRKFLNLKI